MSLLGSVCLAAEDGGEASARRPPPPCWLVKEITPTPLSDVDPLPPTLLGQGGTPGPGLVISPYLAVTPR